MLSRRRGKKAVEPLGAKRAAWVSPRLRPCWAKRSGPKISERFGRSSGPARGIEDPADRCRRVGHQPQQFGRRHRAVRR